MRRLLLICCVLVMIFSLIACSSKKTDMPKEKYIMNGSVALGAVDNENSDKTKVTYSVVISASKEDIENIDEQEPLINMNYYDFILENGPHNAEIKDIETKNPYLEISGSFVFDTSDKSKEEIVAMDLFQGVKIVDKDKKEYILNFNNNSKKWA